MNTLANRQTWRLQGLMDEFLVVRVSELRATERENRMDAAAVRWRLRGWRSDSSAERTLLEIYEALGGGVGTGLSHLERWALLERVWTEVEAAFQTGRLALVKLARPVFMPPQRAETQDTGWKDEAEPTSWVGLVLEDAEGEPVSSQRVRIKLADGTVREGVSDDKGRIRLEGIPEGNCQVEFVGIDASDWRAA